MIYLSDDYLTKYGDVIGYLIGRAIGENYSHLYIEHSISYSSMIYELERSNITTIAFSSCEAIYQNIFPKKDNKGYIYSPYDIYGWLGYIYLHLFLDLEITFELLFILLPINEAIDMYPLYHEMDYLKTLEYVKSKIKYTYLDLIMNNKNLSSKDIANSSGIPFSTIQALRYGKRDIDKLEAYKILLLANSIGVKIESLMTNINLKK